MGRKGDNAEPRGNQRRAATKKNAEGTSKRPTKRKAKEMASTSASHIEEEAPTRTIAPWPKPEDTPITGLHVPHIPKMTAKEMNDATRYSSRKYGDPWGSYNSTFYNGLLRVEMVPTRFVCARTLRRLGIANEVQTMLARIGLGTLAYQTYPLYPDLARQFLASAEIHYENEASPTAGTGKLTYFSSGILYEISIQELCDIYGFDKDRESCSFPSCEEFPDFYRLWTLIASGTCNSRDNKLTLIRNPAIRIVAKIIGHTLYAKEEAGSLRDDELMMLHYGLPDFVHSSYTTSTPPPFDTNMGVIFANVLVSKKFRGLNTTRRKLESIGSLLTPIFRFHGIDLSDAGCVDEIALMDEDFLKRITVLKPGLKYQFTTRDGLLQRCQLPSPEITSHTTLSNVEFLPLQEHLLPTTTRATAARPRGSSSTAPLAPPHPEAPSLPHHFSDQAPSSSQFPPQLEFLLPPYSGEYDLPPPPTDDCADARWNWMVESTQKQNSMMQRIWGALAKIPRPRPPSCFRATEPGDTSGPALSTDDSTSESEPEIDPNETASDAAIRRRRASIEYSSNDTSDTDS